MCDEARTSCVFPTVFSSTASTLDVSAGDEIVEADCKDPKTNSVYRATQLKRKASKLHDKGLPAKSSPQKPAVKKRSVSGQQSEAVNKNRSSIPSGKAIADSAKVCI